MTAESMLSRRSVVIHEDDVAMTHGANAAFAELSAIGTCSAGSVMVPCPWFPEAAKMAATNGTLDVGVHLTLTSEKQPYRWRPLTAPPRSAGLTDDPAQYSEPLAMDRYNAAVTEARADGFPICELISETPWHRESDVETTYHEIFRSVPYGLSFFAFHFNTPGDFEVVEPEYARVRTEEYALFKTPKISEWLREYGLETVGFRDIRSSLRSRWADRDVN